jgi:cysteine sulfinate desulfinase/cysteine desulfurase-like protein
MGPSALEAFGLPEGEVDSAIRVSLSHRTTKEELECFLTSLAAGLSRLARKK